LKGLNWAAAKQNSSEVVFVTSPNLLLYHTSSPCLIALTQWCMNPPSGGSAAAVRLNVHCPCPQQQVQEYEMAKIAALSYARIATPVGVLCGAFSFLSLRM